MLFLAGVLSFLQVFFLPGLLLQSFFPRLQLNLILLIPANMLINFFLSSLLILFNKNTSSSWWLIFLFENALLFLSYSRSSPLKIKNIDKDLVKSFFKLTSSVRFAWPFLFIASICILNALFHYFINRVFALPFHEIQTMFFPLLREANLSIPYLFMDQYSIHFFSYAHMDLVELLCYLSLLVFAVKNKSSLPLIMILLVSYFPRKMIGAHSGSTEMLLFYFSLITLCCLYSLYLSTQNNWALFIGSFAAIAAGETRIEGIFLTLFFIFSLSYLRKKFSLWSLSLLLPILITHLLIGGLTSFQGIPIDPISMTFSKLHQNLSLFNISLGWTYLWQACLVGLLLWGLYLSKSARISIIFALCFIPLARNYAIALPFLIFPMAFPLQKILDQIPGPRLSFPLWKFNPINYNFLVLIFITSFCLTACLASLVVPADF